MKSFSIFRQFAWIWPLPLCAWLLIGGAAAPVSTVSTGQATDWPADFAELRMAAGANDQALWPIAAAASTLSVHVFRAGRAAKLGHNHVLNAPKLSGWLRLPKDGLDESELSATAFELSLRLDELQLDAPAARAALGAGWASSLGPDMIAATRANMLGEAGLQAATYPLLRLRSLRIVGAHPKLAALVEIELHGQRRQQWLALDARRLKDGQGGQAGLSARGALVVRQSDFGLIPFSIGGGLLAVQDELLIEFDLLAKP